MLLVQKPHFENHGSGLEERACSGGGREASGPHYPENTQRFPQTQTQESTACSQPRGPLPSLPLEPRATADPYASLPSAAPPRGSAEVPAGVWIAWASPCPGPQKAAMEAPSAPPEAAAKPGLGAAGPLAGTWGHPLGLFAE